MSETSAFVIFIAAIFTNNILLTNFLGLCSFIACSGQIRTSIGLGTAVTFVMIMTTILNYIIYHFVLVPFGLVHLQFIVFIAVIAAFVQLVEMFVERFSPRLYFALGIFLPLITVNCSILGASLFMIIRDRSRHSTAKHTETSRISRCQQICLFHGLVRYQQAVQEKTTKKNFSEDLESSV